MPTTSKSAGFDSPESDIGAENYRRRYYAEISATMHGHEFYRVAHAQLAPLRIEAQTP